METLIINQSQTNLFIVAKCIELLQKARQRKEGYLKWNKSAIWFTDHEQQRKIEIIDKAIERIENKCREKCIALMIENIKH